MLNEKQIQKLKERLNQYVYNFVNNMEVENTAGILRYCFNIMKDISMGEENADLETFLNNYDNKDNALDKLNHGIDIQFSHTLTNSSGRLITLLKTYNEFYDNILASNDITYKPFRLLYLAISNMKEEYEFTTTEIACNKERFIKLCKCYGVSKVYVNFDKPFSTSHDKGGIVYIKFKDSIKSSADCYRYGNEIKDVFSVIGNYYQCYALPSDLRVKIIYNDKNFKDDMLLYDSYTETILFE